MATLLVHLPFDESSGTNAPDDSGNAYNGTLNGDAGWTTGQIGNAVDLDGSGDFVSVPLDIDPISQISFACWAYPRTNGDRAVFGNSDDGFDRALTARFGQWCIFTGNNFAYTSVDIVVDTWVHIALVFETDNIRLYLDGELAWSNGAAGTGWNGASTFYIGSVSGGGESYFDGLIDDFRIYDGALTAGEVLALSSLTPILTACIVASRGLSASYRSTSASARGIASVGLDPQIVTARGLHRTFNACQASARGVHRVFNTTIAEARGRYGVLNPTRAEARGCYSVGLDPQIVVARGVASVYNAAQASARGAYAVYQPCAAASRGLHRLFNSCIVTARGTYRMLQACHVTARGNHRIANAALDRFELYVGIDAAPDFSAAPEVTQAPVYVGHTPTLDPPIEYTPDLPETGTVDVHLVLRKRNAWNVCSDNLDAVIIRLDATGEEPPIPPSAPVDVAAVAIEGGVVRITARYVYTADAQPATRWLVYVTFDGNDPVVGVTLPQLATVVQADGVAKLTYDTAAQTNGTVVKALVRLRRLGTPNADSTSSPIVTATAVVAGPASVVQGSGFYGTGGGQQA
jgi:hypothetical protein